MKKITINYEINNKLYKFYVEYANQQELKKALDFANQYYIDKLHCKGYFQVVID